jgi:hypothetical protein
LDLEQSYGRKTFAARRAGLPVSLVVFAAVILVVARGQAAPAQSSSESAFLAENDAAMSTMMQGMKIKPSGDVDRDFVDMMVPHHQGAIDMAVAVLRYGHNPQIRRAAQEIIVDQQQEIAAMRLAVGEPLPPSTPAPTGPPSANAMPRMDMK